MIDLILSISKSNQRDLISSSVPTVQIVPSAPESTTFKTNGPEIAPNFIPKTQLFASSRSETDIVDPLQPVQFNASVLLEARSTSISSQEDSNKDLTITSSAPTNVFFPREANTTSKDSFHLDSEINSTTIEAEADPKLACLSPPPPPPPPALLSGNSQGVFQLKSDRVARNFLAWFRPPSVSAHDQSPFCDS
jgi:hypothetical protein